MNIAVYPSDHGYGHITRQLAWIEKIPSNWNINLILVNGNSKNLVDEKLSRKVTVINNQLNPGIIVESDSLKINIDATKKVLDGNTKKLDKKIETEKKFLLKNKIDLIISDISPIPFQASYELEITSLAVSSFTWDWIYEFILPGHPIIEKFKQMYQNANQAFVLPLGEEMKIFKKRKNIPLISRGISKRIVSNKTKRKNLKIFFSMGYSVFPKLNHLAQDDSISIISPHHLFKKENTYISIPKKCKNICKYMEFSDFAVVKTGYSSIAECINLKVPILGVKREGINEDTIIEKWIEKLGIGKAVSFKELDIDLLKTFEWEKYKKAYEKLPKRFENNGHEEIINWIQHLGID